MYLTHTSLRFDKIIWALTTEEEFSVKSSYKSLSPITLLPSFTWIWKLQLPPKLLHFFWICSHDRLPTNNYLANLSIINSHLCPICHLAPETSQHIFFQCHKSGHLWSQLNISTAIQNFLLNNHSQPQWVYHFLKLPFDACPNNIPPKTFFSFCLWQIWLTRNQYVFECKNIPINLPIVI